MIRLEAGLSVARFVTLLGMPRATWYRWRAAVGVDRPAKGSWPAPVVDALEPPAAKHAEAFDAWGYRKIWGLLRADGIVVSQSSVRRGDGPPGLAAAGRLPGRTASAGGHPTSSVPGSACPAQPGVADRLQRA